MFLILSFLLSISTFAQSFSFPKHEFDHQQKRFGIEHSFAYQEKGEVKYILSILKIKKTLSEDLDQELQNAISGKKRSQKSPWSKVLVNEKTQLNLNSKTKGLLAEVSYQQNNLPQSALLGFVPAGEHYYFIYTSSETLNFNNLKKVFRKFIQDIRFGL